MTAIKIITFLYPFLKELLLGKYSDSPYAKHIRLATIVLIIVSILLNFYLVKSAVELGKYKINSVKKIADLESTNITLNEQVNKLIIENKSCLSSHKRNQEPKIPPQQPPIVRREDLDFDERLQRKLRDIQRMED